MIVLGVTVDPGYTERVKLAMSLWPGNRLSLADAMGMTAPTRDIIVWHYMHGRPIRDLRRLQALCQAVDVPSGLVLNGPTEDLQVLVRSRLNPSESPCPV